MATTPYSETLRPQQASRPPISLIAAAALASTALLAGYLFRLVNWRHAALFIIGAFAGLVLYHAAFGFSTAWREAIINRRSAGLRAQMVMLVLASTLFVILLSLPQPVFGLTLQPNLAPLSLSVVFGAFLFGIGMQLGGGCASGTLYTAGSGNTRMVVTLAAFILGSLIATRHVFFWNSVPSFQPVSLLVSFCPLAAIVITFIVCGGIGYAAAQLERARHGAITPITAVPDSISNSLSFLRGPWPLLWGAIGLVVVNVATLLLAGRPWGITSALALWGAKFALAIGIDVSSWPYWSEGPRAAALSAPVLSDVTSVMDIGIMLGALTAAGFAGRFAPVWRIPWKSLAAALIGGLLLGYGSRISFGCNIGAYFSGVASTSLH
ncbi:MAG: hypothetical protein A3F68_13560, partial [Acidobacteria bacterium RIFCSPLOWO2_12_FULL_54_10]